MWSPCQHCFPTAIRKWQLLATGLLLLKIVCCPKKIIMHLIVIYWPHFQQFAIGTKTLPILAGATICLIAANFVWTGLSCNVHTWSSQCLPCQTSKTTRHISTPIAVFPFLMCHSPWWIMNINIFDLLPSCDSFHILLTTMDRSTRWPKAFPISDVSTAILVSAVGCHCLASLLF